MQPKCLSLAWTLEELRSAEKTQLEILQSKGQSLAWTLEKSEAATQGKGAPQTPPSAEKTQLEILWPMVFLVVALYTSFVYCTYLFMTHAMWTTRIFTFLLYIISGLSITAGAHRLWCHRSYKARMPLRIMLMLWNNIALQYSVLNWARDHRMHHKYSETDADPHNAKRGFVFAHIGWLAMRKHPAFDAKLHTIDMSDLHADPVLRFQQRFYVILAPLSCFILPTYVPTLWGESLWNGFACALFRFWLSINITAMVNSVAHLWGSRPYDKHINPVEIKPLCLIALGEGYHNYHHTYPWDYKTGELGEDFFNFTTLFIDLMAKIGWAYDLKTVSPDIIEKRVKRTGDGTHHVWGWDDAPVGQKMTASIVPEKCA